MNELERQILEIAENIEQTPNFMQGTQLRMLVYLNWIEGEIGSKDGVDINAYNKFKESLLQYYAQC